LADGGQQTGYLSLPFHRVYFNNNSVHQEALPDKCFKIPLGVRTNYFLGDKIIHRAYYRYYTDDWGLKSNTSVGTVWLFAAPTDDFSIFLRKIYCE